MNTFETDQLYVANTYKRFPVELVKGQGATAWDAEGKSYIDLGAGIAVNTFGFCDQPWIDAVTKQMSALSHSSNLYYTAPCANLAKALCKRTGMKKVFFGNSGAEANECAIKVARKYGEAKGRYEIITLKNSFHGRTIATLAATGQDHFHEHFGPFPEGFLYAEANNLESVKALIGGKTCAVLVECVQGEGGVVALDRAFLQGVQELCHQNDSLFMVDEVQTGNGRSGRLYSYMCFDLAPDVVTTAKGLGGGLPIGACLIGEKAENALSFGDHGSTFGGNPTVCAGALSILSRLTDEFLSQVRAKSDYVFRALSGAKGVKSVTGLGLMIGVECEKPAGDVLAYCRAHGALPLSAKTKVRLLPPLSITMTELTNAIEILKEALAQ